MAFSRLKEIKSEKVMMACGYFGSLPKLEYLPDTWIIKKKLCFPTFSGILRKSNGNSPK